MPVSAKIPESYVKSENSRLQLYKQIFSAEDEDTLIALRSQVHDRYGALPEESKLLFHVAMLKQKLAAIGVVRFASGRKGLVEMQFGNVTAMNKSKVDRLLEAIANNANLYQIAPDNRVMLKVEVPQGLKIHDQYLVIKELNQAIEPLVLAIS